MPLKCRLRRKVSVDSEARSLTKAAHVKLSSRSRVSALSGERPHTRALRTGRSAERLEAIMLKSSRVRELLCIWEGRWVMREVSQATDTGMQVSSQLFKP